MILKYPLHVRDMVFEKGTTIRYATEDEILERIPNHNKNTNSHPDWSMVVVDGLEKPIIIASKQIDHD